ncbi:hypothetical protein G4B88_012889 [Cannabis sativa]|uniref:Uncharacterized protein n=1 Tax=Cannabis sativa TaxID=3483 RepID=A0A7J6F533_CANSA|nr:hypothetical protein G4B88_012889 [Cannabis sativa]
MEEEEGNGAAEAALAAFGADQFDEEDPKERHSKASFFTYFYLALNLGALAAETILVYIEDMGQWVLAFRICTLSSIVAYGFLLSGNLRYRRFKPCGNPISRFSQVIVASFRKFNLKMPLNGDQELYEVDLKESERNGMRRILHSNGFKFLDRAAIIMTEDMKLITTTTEGKSTQNPWHVCTVTQVEEVKCVLRLLPIWLCTIFSSVVFVQMLSLFIEQGAVMNRRVFNFDIPPASMTVFDFIFTSLFIILYERLLLPVRNHPSQAATKVPRLDPIGSSLDKLKSCFQCTRRLAFHQVFLSGQNSPAFPYASTSNLQVSAFTWYPAHSKELEIFKAPMQSPLWENDRNTAMYISSVGLILLASISLTILCAFPVKAGDKQCKIVVKKEKRSSAHSAKSGDGSSFSVNETILSVTSLHSPDIGFGSSGQITSAASLTLSATIAYFGSERSRP